ncbi:transposable element Tcb2 transposase [Trichonephila clavipes]|nr:transposable element Tcb2 transposase [Trichonephila clavipes]
MHECVVCFKNKPIVANQLMGSLPRERINPSFPFLHTGIDYSGPFFIRYKHQRKGTYQKIYVAIFVCLASKAVHLEIVSDLTTDAFLATLKRFVARRGKCATISSDNAKNFVGANRELKRLHNLLKFREEKLSSYLPSEGISWNFMPPRAPNFGGLWEAGVKSFKFYLKRAVGNLKMILAEFLTIITQIEGILNSRPITPLSEDIDDLEVLTPGHFLIGRPITSISEPNLLDKTENTLSRWQKLTKIVQHIWTKWPRDYLNNLQQRNNWQFHKDNVKLNTMVIIKDGNLPVNKWSLGRITKLVPGTDGKVRVVEIKTNKGNIKRSIGKFRFTNILDIIHRCVKIKDEVEKLAYQLNEEAEWTERPIRRLSKVMYGSTCADMQVDVMRECLSSIKHIVGTTSGCFYPRSNHWEVGGKPQCDKCGCRIRNCSQHRFTTLEIISNYRNSYPGFSSGRPRRTTPADDRYIVLQARRNRRQTAGEIARHTTQATGRPISRFTVARRLHGGGLFARRPVRCVPLTPAHRRRRSLWCREHRNWRDNEWGRVLFTDESRFSLSSDSHRILIWRERGSRNHPSNIIERDRYGGRGVLVWGGIMLGSRTDLHIFDAGSVNGTRYCNEILLPYVRLFRGAMGLQFLFMDDNAPCHRTVAAEQLLESRRLAARTLPPVTIRELRLALQDEWAAMPQQLIDTLILSMGRRCETCLAVRGDHIPY